MPDRDLRAMTREDHAKLHGMDDTERPLLPDWRARVIAALDEIDRRMYTLRGASVALPSRLEDFEELLRIAQGDELPAWEGPELPPLNRPEVWRMWGPVSG